MTISTSKRRAGRLVASIVLAATAAGTAGDRADAGSDESFTLRGDGLAGRGADRRVGGRRRRLRGGPPGRHGRVQLPGRRPVPDDRPAQPAEQRQPAGRLLRVGRRPPRGRVEQGFALDLSSAVAETELGELFDESAFNSMTVDDQIVMVPGNADVTNVIWYNVDLFDELGLAPPATWDEFLALCPTIADEVCSRCRSATSTCGPAHRRVAGHRWEAYGAMMREELAMDAPEVVEGSRCSSSSTVAASTSRSTRSTTTRAPSCSSRARRRCTRSAAGSSRGQIEEPRTSTSTTQPPSDRRGRGAGQRHGRRHRLRRQRRVRTSRGGDRFPHAVLVPEFTAQMVEAGGTPMAKGAMEREDIDAPHPPPRRPQRGVDGDRPARHRLRPAPPRRKQLDGAEAEVLGGQSDAADAAASAADRLEGQDRQPAMRARRRSTRTC